MKKYGCCVLRRPIMLGMFLMLAVSFGYAQSGIRVKIPFTFGIGGRTFPAGEYSLGAVAQFPHTVLLRSQTGGAPSYLGTNSMQSRDVASSSKLVFNRYGGQYFLTQMWIAGSEIGWETMKSPLEIQLAKYSPGQQTVLLSLNSK
jgi:hypothetical protein